MIISGGLFGGPMGYWNWTQITTCKACVQLTILFLQVPTLLSSPLCGKNLNMSQWFISKLPFPPLDIHIVEAAKKGNIPLICNCCQNKSNLLNYYRNRNTFFKKQCCIKQRPNLLGNFVKCSEAIRLHLILLLVSEIPIS